MKITKKAGKIVVHATMAELAANPKLVAAIKKAEVGSIGNGDTVSAFMDKVKMLYQQEFGNPMPPHVMKSVGKAVSNAGPVTAPGGAPAAGGAQGADPHAAELSMLDKFDSEDADPLSGAVGGLDQEEGSIDSPLPLGSDPASNALQDQQSPKGRFSLPNEDIRDGEAAVDGDFGRNEVGQKLNDQDPNPNIANTDSTDYESSELYAPHGPAAGEGDATAREFDDHQQDYERGMPDSMRQPKPQVTRNRQPIAASADKDMVKIASRKGLSKTGNSSEFMERLVARLAK